MLKQESIQEIQIRNKIIEIIDIMLSKSAKKNEAMKILNSLHQHFLQKEHIFSLNSLVYTHFVQLLSSIEFQIDYVALSTFKKQLLGQIPYWNTYALKYNFTQILPEEYLDAYKKLQQLVIFFENPPIETPIQYENFMELLHELCYEKLLPYTIGEFLVIYCCHIMLKLPQYDQKSFDILDSLSSIYPVSSLELTINHVNFINNLLQKLKGELVLFVDVTITSGGYVINFR